MTPQSYNGAGLGIRACRQAKQAVPGIVQYSGSDELPGIREDHNGIGTSATCAIWTVANAGHRIRMPSSRKKQDRGSLLRLGQLRFLPEFIQGSVTVHFNSDICSKLVGYA